MAKEIPAGTGAVFVHASDGPDIVGGDRRIATEWKVIKSTVSETTDALAEQVEHLRT